MTFSQLLIELHETEEQPNPHYYRLLIANSTTIILEIAKRNQHLVAQDLNMDRMRLNHLMPLLRELSYA